MSSSKFLVVKSLSDQCLDHIIIHLEEYPPSYLALLPFALRKEILWRLPMADVCSLEDTGFMKGIDTGEYWRSTFSEFDSFAVPDQKQGSIRKYFEERWKGLMKAVVHGMISGLCFGLFALDHSGFQVFSSSSSDISPAISLMFGLRDEEDKEYGNQMVRKSNKALPPSYQQYGSCSSREDLWRSVMECFKGNLPTYLHMEYIEETACSDVFEYVPRFKNLRYLGLENQKFGPKLQELIVGIALEAANLEVLCWRFEPPGVEESPWPLQSLDGLISKLSESPFMSRMCLLMAYSWFDESDLDMERGFFTISYGNLKKFIDALRGTPTNHCQVLCLEGTVIACNSVQELRELINFTDSDCSSKKVIEIYKCKFSVVSGTL